MSTPTHISWLRYGTEICHACSQPYVYEMEVRCVGCDRGLCEQCAVIERATSTCWCSPCHAELSVEQADGREG